MNWGFVLTMAVGTRTLVRMFSESIGVEQVADMVTDITRVTDHLDPDAVPDGQVKGVIDHLATAQRLIEGALTMMARRTTDPVGTDPKADQRAAALLAKTTGTTTAVAKRRLKTSRRLNKQATVADAVRRGELSGGQTEVIAETCDTAPAAQGELVEAAAEQSLSDLRQNCRDRRQQADSNRDATHRRHHHRRSMRSWNETDGEWRASLSAPADIGARFEAALRADHDAIFKAAHAAGRREQDACYRLDALLALVERGAVTAGHDAARNADDGEAACFGPDDPGVAVESIGAKPRVTRAPARRSARQTMVIVNVDLAALRRGRLATGERCRIEGVGEVSLAAVKALIPGAHLAYVVRDGVDIKSVVHLGRQATAHQRTALLARGYVCEVPHCNAAHLLEIDHTRDWAFSRHTVIDELGWFCTAHHADKTNRGHRLQGPPGRRRWVTANGVEVSRDPGCVLPRVQDLDPRTADLVKGGQRGQVQLFSKQHRGP